MGIPANRAYDVLVTQEWPLGWCPEHYGDEWQCTWACIPVRVAFKQLSDDFDRYWRSVGLVQERTA